MPTKIPFVLVEEDLILLNLNQIAINRILIFLDSMLFQSQTELHQFGGRFLIMGQTDLSQCCFVEGNDIKETNLLSKLQFQCL